jgi:hypothetical protein
MKVCCETLKAAHWLLVPIRSYCDVMGAVADIDAGCIRMNYLQARIVRLQSLRPFLPLLPVSPQLLLASPDHPVFPPWKNRVRLGPVTIG